MQYLQDQVITCLIRNLGVERAAYNLCSGTFRFGCAPAIFSGQNPTSGTLQLAAPPKSNSDVCNPLTQEYDPEKYAGKVIFANRGKCMFCVKVMKAIAVNASAVIIANIVDSFPIFMTWSSICSPLADNPQIDPTILGIPVCMTSRSDGARIHAVSDKLEFDLSHYRRYNPQSELLPENEITGIRVQQHLGDSYTLPAGQVHFIHYQSI
jgi:hypothetical protein